MDELENIYLEDCPCCGGVGSIEEEGGWCVYIQCLDCGAHTSAISYDEKTTLHEAAKLAADNWNARKVHAPGPGE